MKAQKINDHSSWIGKGSEKSVLPVGNKVKSLKGQDDKQWLNPYEDGESDISKQQDIGEKKVEGHPQRPLFRN